jgi:hypothetical protein
VCDSQQTGVLPQNQATWVGEDVAAISHRREPDAMTPEMTTRKRDGMNRLID